MLSIAADPSRRLLELKFSERVSPDEIRAKDQRVRELLAQLGSGFNLLTDLSGLAEMELACRPLIDAMMDLFNRHGIAKVVRVIPDPGKDIGFGIMSLFHYGQHVRVVTCETLEQARKEFPI